MTTTIASSSFNPPAIRKEVYQAVYDIWPLPNDSDNHHLLASLGLPNENHVQMVNFGATKGEGASVLSVAVTMLKNVGEGRWRLHWKNKWEFEGFLWHCHLHARKEGSRTIDAEVKGTWDSSSGWGKGKLYVLAHEQPKSLVEVLRWDEMCEWVKTYDLAIFKMCGRNGAWDAKIDYLVEASHRSGKLSMKCTVDLYHFLTAGAVSPPLALADGRVLFSADGLDCTIYKPGTYGKK